MEARILAFLNAKGGCGKTTISVSVAAALSRRGYKVLVVDGDSAGGASRWCAAAPEEAPFPLPVVNLSTAAGKIHKELEKFVNDYDFLVVDCPPAAKSPVPRSVLLVSDLAVVPVIPSPMDLWMAVEIRDTIDEVRMLNETLEARLVLNMVNPGRVLSRDVPKAIPQFGIDCFGQTIAQREVFRSVLLDGRTIYDTGRSGAKAIDEIEALTNEILTTIGEATTAALVTSQEA